MAEAPSPLPEAMAATLTSVSSGRLQRWWGQRSMPQQAAGVALAGALLACAGVAWATGLLSAGEVQGAVNASDVQGALGSTGTQGASAFNALHATLLGALAVAIPAVALARHWASAAQRIGAAAHQLRRDDAPPEAHIPLLDHSAELHRASHRLRRLVEIERERRHLLQQRNVALGQQLQTRTHELSTLQDLSVNLASSSDMHGLVDEALKALEQTLDYASASVWSRDLSDPATPVVLMGYRSSEGDGLDPGRTDAAPAAAGPPSMLGMRLSRPNVQRFEQIERERLPIIDNDARQSLLSWLWAKVVDDARSSRLYGATRAWMGVPLKFHEHVLGVLRVDHTESGYFTPERARLLSAVCSQTALAMRHAQLHLQQREMAVLAERNRIARDLHDAVSQTLFAATVLAGTMARVAARGSSPASATLHQQALTLERLNRGALAEMRLLMVELKPDALEQTPLSELLQLAIEALSSRGDVRVEPMLAGSDDLPAATRTQLYRIAQEALSNIAKHSAATQAVVHWQCAGSQASLRIADDGCGFDSQAQRPGHFGLGHMAERAVEIGARFSLISAPGEGTEIKVELT